jgi:hypothetical protein
VKDFKLILNLTMTNPVEVFLRKILSQYDSRVICHGRPSKTHFLKTYEAPEVKRHPC